MQVILSILSAALVVLALWDVFITGFSSSSAWRWRTRLLWRGLLAVHNHRPIHKPLSLAGPLMLLIGIVIWYLLLYLGFFLAVAVYPPAVLDSSSGGNVNQLQRLYFVGTTISGLGYGDLVPGGFPWTVASAMATLVATIVITTSLSYVLAVLAASIERRSLAQGIFGLGDSTVEIVQRSRLGDPQAMLRTHVISLAGQMDRLAFKHLAYPVLQFFHSPSARASPARAVLTLSDACFLLSQLPEPHRPPAGLLELVQSSIANYINLEKGGISRLPVRGQPPRSLIDAAQHLGIMEKLNHGADGAMAVYLARRRHIQALCREDGWHEP